MQSQDLLPDLQKIEKHLTDIKLALHWHNELSADRAKEVFKDLNEIFRAVEVIDFKLTKAFYNS